MSKLAIFMADGCEEIEGLTVVDLVRRAGIAIDMVSIREELTVTGAHGIKFMADKCFQEVAFDEYDGFILPGGMPGTINLGESEFVCTTMKKAYASGKLCAAICAAPSVLGQLGILEGLNATCYPGFEEKLTGAKCRTKAVVKDDNVITSRGMGTAIEFGLEIVAYFTDEATAKKLEKGIIYK
ncbi:MAG: DJ-1/PfpI family protein [Lachnospiraceae bacterium]|nr:DJ-1/PfpI family protein [Lachnospiraceae bacterium]